MNVKRWVLLIEGLTVLGSGAMILWWAIVDGIPEFLFFTVALWLFGYYMIRRSQRT